MKKFAIAVSVGAAALAAVAFAAHHEGAEEEAADEAKKASFEDMFAAIDASGDGNINGDEFMAYKLTEAEKEWSSLAVVAGEDGLLSLAEAKAHHDAMMAEPSGT
jgi:hypothetical protein